MEDTRLQLEAESLLEQANKLLKDSLDGTAVFTIDHLTVREVLHVLRKKAGQELANQGILIRVVSFAPGALDVQSHTVFELKPLISYYW